jgi:tetratricopeptide (TPR) repeat protein
VISRTSVMQYKGAHRPLREIARELGVDAIIEGTVLRAGDQVRISAQLIDARDDHHLWAQSYERELSAVLQIQSEVARAVASRIEIVLAPREAARLAAPKPVDVHAQDSYLKGLHRLGLANPVAVKQAIEDFEEAIRSAPDYALAYSALARANFYLGFEALGVMDRGALERARSAALRAIELDGDLAAAHAVLAGVDWYIDWNWAQADREYRRAFELNPSEAYGLAEYAVFLAVMDRRDEAVARVDEAVDLAPLDLAIRSKRAAVQFFVGRPERTLSDAEWVLEIEAGYVPALSMAGLAEQALGRYEDAARSFRHLDERLPPELQSTSGLAQAFRDGGSVGYWNYIRRSSKSFGDPYGEAIACIALGDVDGAFAALDRAYEARGTAVTFVLTAPLEPLHGDPRFAELVRRMNLPVPSDPVTRSAK